MTDNRGGLPWVLALILTGCPMPADDTGDTGDPTAEPVSTVCGSFRWHDANGMQITDGEEPVIFDAEGNLWQLNLETGAVTQLEIARDLYAEPNCGGKEYAEASPPNVVVRLDRSSESLIRDPNVRAVCARSRFDLIYEACEPVSIAPCRRVVPVGSHLPVESRRPNGGIGPYHPEPCRNPGE